MKHLATILCITLAAVLFFGVPAFSADESADESIEALGDKNQDFVYTPVRPCRIVDTRRIVGAFGAGESREYHVYGDVSGQNGGDAPYRVNCPSPRGEPRAVHINVTAIGGDSNGNFRVYPAGTTTPATSWVNWQAHKNVANQGTVKTKFSRVATAKDIEVYALSGAHLAIDVLGYYHEVDPLFLDEDFRSGPAPNVLHVAPHLDFVAPVAVVEITRNNQKIFVDSTNLFCSTDRGGRIKDLTLWICYQDVEDPGLAGIMTVGEGITALAGGDVTDIAIDDEQGIPMGMSAFIYDLPKGKYHVGLCGVSPRDWDDWNGCHAPKGYTTAFVVPE